MVGRDLALSPEGDLAIPVTLAPARGDAEEASGLAHMLHQFFEQTLGDSPEKRRLARRLRGEAIFRSAEDETIAVRIHFDGGSIELCDVGAGDAAGTASVTGDFLSIAHLTSGRESPFALLARRRLRARFAPGEIAFLFRMLAVMRIAKREGSRAWIWPAVLAGVVLAAVVYGLV